MSEMLGNQYFMARKYKEAEAELEKCLERYPENKYIGKKLIICYSQTGKLELALDLFYSIISRDITLIVNTDPVEDDCPCPELVYDMENGRHNPELFEDFLKLGILWLYCNPQKSYNYLKKALDLRGGYPKLKAVTSIIGKFIGKTGKAESDVIYGY